MNKTFKQISTKMILLGVSFLFFIHSYSQKDSMQGNRYFNFYISQINYAHLEVRTQGVKLLETAFAPSAEIGFEFTKFTKNMWGYKMGANVSLIRMSFYYYFYSNTISQRKEVYQIQDLDITHSRSSRLSFNISGFKDVKLSKNNFLHTQFGLDINMIKVTPSSITFTYYDENGDRYTFYHIDLKTRVDHGSQLMVTPSFSGKIGLVTKLKNKNLITFNIVASLHPISIYDGYFYFNTKEFESKGLVSFRPSYFGLEFNYAFFKGNNKIKKKRN